MIQKERIGFVVGVFGYAKDCYRGGDDSLYRLLCLHQTATEEDLRRSDSFPMQMDGLCDIFRYPSSALLEYNELDTTAVCSKELSC